MSAVPQRKGLASRALLAVALMVGFYALALSLAITIVLIPFAEFYFLHRVESVLLFTCLGAAGTIVLALVPRPDRFIPPGPALDRKTHPALFAMVDEIAAATKQPVPSRVFLLNDVNAWVSERGGVMGIGSHHVMGVGWPLLQMLSPIELKAVIAHEFGHYVSGDVRLGPWIYKTRATITRAVIGAKQSWLRAVFIWYGRLFLRLTQSVSRQQEFVADEIAATTVGAQPLMGALRRVAVLAPAFAAYMSNDVLPVLRAGRLPPLASGFRTFVTADEAAEWMHSVAALEEARSETDEFDSHPSLKDRLRALATLESKPLAEPDAATLLLSDADRHAQMALTFSFGADDTHRLQPITWQAVGPVVFTPLLRSMVEQHRAWYGALTSDALDGDRARYQSMGTVFTEHGPHEEDPRERIRRATRILTAAIAVALVDRGWAISVETGRSFVLSRGAEVFEPHAALQAMIDGRTTAAEWREKCRALEISGCRLAGETAELVTPSAAR